MSDTVLLFPEISQPTNATNPIVFLDIQLDKEYIGRIIIELRKDVVPKTVENFRGLCTGEYGIGSNGKPLHYKGNLFHKITRVYCAQGGDIINNDGTSGESIYGPIFEDENFVLKHDEGVVSMTNCSIPNTNNSQFFITTVECHHMNGTNVVFGKVLRGLEVIVEVEKYSDQEGRSSKSVFIADCGEIKQGEDWGYCEKDGTELPTFPQDWKQKNDKFEPNEIKSLLTIIRNSGNYFFKNGDYLEALRKYKKADRYLRMFRNKYSSKEAERSGMKTVLDDFTVLNNLNTAAVELKLENFSNVVEKCNEAIAINPHNSKAFFRRGLAHKFLKNYDESLNDFKIANLFAPGDKLIAQEAQQVQKLHKEYYNVQRDQLKNLFKY